MDANLQTAVFFSDKINGHQNSINFQELEVYLNKIPEVVQTWYLPEISKSNLKKVTAQIRKHWLNRIIIAGDMPEQAYDIFIKAMILTGNNSNDAILANFRKHGAITKADTNRIKAILTYAIFNRE